MELLINHQQSTHMLMSHIGRLDRVTAWYYEITAQSSIVGQMLDQETARTGVARIGLLRTPYMSCISS